MALEFMKIPGLQKILTSLDFKSYLIGVDKLPDYRTAEYCTYFITEDVTARSGKLYYDKVPQAKGGYAYDVCSHFKMTFDEHFSSMKYYEFSQVKPVAFRINGSSTAGGTKTPLYMTLNNENKLRTVTLGDIQIDVDKNIYYRRNIGTDRVERVVSFTTGSDTYMQAQGNFYGWITSGSKPGSTYWKLNAGASTYTALGNDLSGSVAAYESANNCRVFIRLRSASSTALNVCTLYNCGWYLGVASSDTIYDVDISLGALMQFTMSTGTNLAEKVMTSVSDLTFVKNKTYYIKTSFNDLTIKYSNDVAVDLNYYNVEWMFQGYKKLRLGEDYSFNQTIAQWRADHGDIEVYTENSNYWLQANNFVGTLTRNYEWYERAGDRFPYVGFIAIATSNYNGQQKGGFYHAVKREYALTEDETRHFRWTDDLHTATKSKIYYEWDERTNTYTPRDGDPNGEGLIYRLMDGSTYFQKPIETTYIEGKTYYDENGEIITGWVPGQPIEDGVCSADRPCFYRNGWTISAIPDDARYGVTSDLTPVSGKTYYIHTEGNTFAPIPTDNFYTVTNDVLVQSGKAYYYITKESRNAIGMNKFVDFPASDFEGFEVGKLPYVIYEKNMLGEIPTEVQICVPFGQYTSGGSTHFDGITVPNDVEIVIESRLGEAILPDCYYEKCYGMYVWEQYFLERGVSVTKPYNVTAIYVETGSAANTKVSLNIMWTDPKFMLHIDDPNASPDAWAKTDVILEYVDEDTNEPDFIRLASEVATNDIYANDFLSLTSDNVRDFSGAVVSADTFKHAVRTGKVRIIATANTGIKSEYVVRPSKVVWLNSEKSFVPINPIHGVAVEGVEYYTINADGKEVKVADIVPYTSDISGYYVKYQDSVETYVFDESSSKYNLITIGDASHPVGQKVENQTLFTRITDDPEITIRDLVRAGLFDKLFTHGLSGQGVGTVLGECPVLKPDGSAYGNTNVTVVDVDGASLGYNIERGYEDVTTVYVATSDEEAVQGKVYYEKHDSLYVEASVEAGDDISGDELYERIRFGEPGHPGSVILDESITYYAKKCVTLKACADESKDANEVYYDLVPVVDLSVYGGHGAAFTTKGVLFTRTHPNPHYKIFINTKNAKVNTGRFQLDATYSIRKSTEVAFVTLTPDYRGPDTLLPDPYNKDYYYDTENLGNPDLHDSWWFHIPRKDAATRPNTSFVYLYQPSNGKGVIIAQTTDSEFLIDKQYYRKQGTDYPKLVSGVDYQVGDDISTFGQTVYCDTTVDVDTDETYFTAKWDRDRNTLSVTYGKWRFVQWEFNSNRKYYIKLNQYDYEIGSLIHDWVVANDTSVYMEMPGINTYLDVTEFGMDALRGCTVPLFIKDMAIVDGESVPVYVTISRPAHNVTFRYSVPLTTQSTFGTIAGATEAGTYWDNSLVRSNLLTMVEPDPTITTGYKEYCEFYENHIIPVISTVFKNWNADKYDVAQVFDKFWLPCLGNFAQTTMGSIVGIPSEGGPLDLYTKGVGEGNHHAEVMLARKVTNSSNSIVPWFIRTCPKTTVSGGVVGVINEDGELVVWNKHTACNVVPHFTVA